MLGRPMDLCWPCALFKAEPTYRSRRPQVVEMGHVGPKKGQGGRKREDVMQVCASSCDLPPAPSFCAREKRIVAGESQHVRSVQHL